MRVPQCQKGEGRSCHELTCSLSPKCTNFERPHDVLPALLPAPDRTRVSRCRARHSTRRSESCPSTKSFDKSFGGLSPTSLPRIPAESVSSLVPGMERGRGSEEWPHVLMQAGLPGAGGPQSLAERGALSSWPHTRGHPLPRGRSWAEQSGDLDVSHDEKHKDACEWSGLRLNSLKKKNGTSPCGGGCGGGSGCTSHPGPQG